MGSETVPKGMTNRGLRDTAGPDGLLDGVLQVSLRDVVPACLAASRIDGKGCNLDHIPLQAIGREA